jgi:hypothetical protein
MSRHDPAVNSFYRAFQDAGVTEAEHTQSKFVTIAFTSSVRGSASWRGTASPED